MGSSRTAAAALILCFALLLSGCVTLVDPEASQEQASEVIAVLGEGETFHQTFLARRPGLNGISIWASADQESPTGGSLEIELYRAEDASTPLERFSLSSDRLVPRTPVPITFTPLPGPGAQLYTLKIRADGFSARLFGRNANVHPYGAASLNGTALDADLAFRLSYDYGFSAVFTDLRRALENLPLIFPLALVLFFPGWLLVNLFLPKGRSETEDSDRFDWVERFLLSIGLSMALAPLVLTWTTQLGLRWTRWAVLVAAVVLCILALYNWYRSSFVKRILPVLRSLQAASPGLVAWLRCLQVDWIGMGLFGVFALSLFVRIGMVRDVSAPPWVDSVHHATITRRILEEGAFPDTYAPYIEIETARYHAGFHSLLAFFTALSGQQIDEAMLIFCQVLNALAAVGVYLFTTALIRDRRAGLLAALFASLLTPMPAYYTSWGRYTQLAGLVIFPAVLALLIHTFDLYEAPPGPHTRRVRLGVILLAGIAGGGLFITHYRVAAFLACLLVTYLPLRWWSYRRTPDARRRIGYDLASLGAAALVGILLTLPWWPETVSSLFLTKVDQWRGVGEPFSEVNWGLLTPVMGLWVLVLAGAGLLLGLLQLRRFQFVLILWVLLMFFLAYLGPLGLPGGGFVNATSVEISLFIPASTAAGFFVSRVLGAWGRGLPVRLLTFNRLATGLAALALSLAAARLQLPLLLESTFMFRNADRPAVYWMSEHLPRDATVMINPSYWGYNLYAGADGGYWISPLAGLKTMPPPVLYGLADDYNTVRAINAIVEEAMRTKEDPSALAAFLRSKEVNYLYIGARGGVFSPSLLENSAEFQTLYKQNGVWVFQIRGN